MGLSASMAPMVWGWSLLHEGSNRHCLDNPGQLSDPPVLEAYIDSACALQGISQSRVEIWSTVVA